MEFTWKSYSDSRWEEESVRPCSLSLPSGQATRESVWRVWGGGGGEGSGTQAQRRQGGQGACLDGGSGSGTQRPGSWAWRGRGGRSLQPAPEEALGPADSGLSTAPDGEVGESL